MLDNIIQMIGHCENEMVITFLTKNSQVYSNHSDIGQLIQVCIDANNLKMMSHLLDFAQYKDRLQLNRENLNALEKACVQGHAQAVKFILELDHFTSQDTKYGKEKEDLIGKKNEYIPLLLAVANGHSDVVKVLHDSGADMMIRDSRGATALHWACAQGYIEVVNALLECGLEVNALDNKGFSALIIAAEQGQLDIVNSLLAAGANMGHHNQHDNTALVLASRNGHHHVVERLLTLNPHGQSIYKAFGLAVKRQHAKTITAFTQANINERRFFILAQGYRIGLEYELFNDLKKLPDILTSLIKKDEMKLCLADLAPIANELGVDHKRVNHIKFSRKSLFTMALLNIPIPDKPQEKHYGYVIWSKLSLMRRQVFNRWFGFKEYTRNFYFDLINHLRLLIQITNVTHAFDIEEKNALNNFLEYVGVSLDESRDFIKAHKAQSLYFSKNRLNASTVIDENIGPLRKRLR